MPRYDERSGPTRLYVGHISSRTRTRDLEDLFSKYGRVRDVDMKQDFAFVDFFDSRDADDARHYLNGRNFEGSRIAVEFAKKVNAPCYQGPRSAGGAREYMGRGPTPGTGRCYNCGHDGHWARDCKAGDWKNKCYRCGQRGHIERDCHSSPSRRTRLPSRSRSQSRSRSPVAARRRSRSRSYSRSPRKERGVAASPEQKRRVISSSRSPRREERRTASRSPASNGQNPGGGASRSVSRSPQRSGSPRPSRHGVSPSPHHRSVSMSPRRSMSQSPLHDAEPDQRSPVRNGHSPSQSGLSPAQSGD